MDLTGMELHQWIGILVGILAVFHLLAHLDWVTAITKRFFTKAPGRARAYYILDGLLLAGFSLIVLTGLVLSTWLNLPFTNYTAWLNIHITFSIAALMTVLLKMILHWRWIANVSSGIFAKPAAAPVGNLVLQPARVRTGHIGRRKFLKVFSLAGAASVLALCNASKALAETISENKEVA
jgi:predicted ferric reductase